MKRPQLLFDIMSTVVYDPIFAEIPGFFGLTLAEFFAAATLNPKAKLIKGVSCGYRVEEI